MGTTTSSGLKDEDSFYSPMCCMRARSHPEEPISHLSWQRSSLRVSHQGKPGPPEGIVQLENITHNSIVLSWLPPLDRGFGQILAYHVERFSYKDKKWQTVTETCQGNSYKVRDLISGTKYIFRVRAENMVGVGRPSIESDSVIPPNIDAVDEVDSNVKDGATTFTRRGSNFLDSGSSVKAIVNRSLDATDNLERWSFPRQQSRRRTTLDSILKRPYSTGHRSSLSTGFRDSKRLLKNNPLFVDDMEASKKADLQKDLIDKTIKVVETSQNVSVGECTSGLKEPTPLSAYSDEETETVMIISKGFAPALEKFSKRNSEPLLVNERRDSKTDSKDVKRQFKCRRISMSDSLLQPKPEDDMLEYDLDETGIKVPLKRRSSSKDRINIRKPLHGKLFTPLGEDSLDEYESLEQTETDTHDNSRKGWSSEDELGSDDIQEVVKSLTSLYHSQVSLCELADAGKTIVQQDLVEVPGIKTSADQTTAGNIAPVSEEGGKKLKTVEEPLTSEYDGSASDSDEGRSTIPKVMSVFNETDTSCDDDPTDTSASSHNDQPSSDTEIEELDNDPESDSDLSLTDYFGDESDDSADIDSLNETQVKQSPKVKLPDTSDDEEPKVHQPHTIDVQVHATATPVVKKRHKHVKQDKTQSESDSTGREGVKNVKHRSSKSATISGSPEASVVEKSPETLEIVENKKDKSLPMVDSASPKDSLAKDSLNKDATSLQKNSLDKNIEVIKSNAKDSHVEVVKNLPNKDIADAIEQRDITPPGSDEGVDMETMSDTEVVIIHSNEVITRLQELMAKDQKLSDILLNHPQLKKIVQSPVTKPKTDRDSRSKVTFADMKQNKL